MTAREYAEAILVWRDPDVADVEEIIAAAVEEATKQFEAKNEELRANYIAFMEQAGMRRLQLEAENAKLRADMEEVNKQLHQLCNTFATET